MTRLSLFILSLSVIIYLAAFFFHLLSFLSVQEKGHRAAYTFLRIGFLLSIFYFAAEAVESHFFLPVANLSQALAFFAWSLGFVYLVLLARVQTDSFGLILTPILVLLVLFACLTFKENPPPLQIAGNPLFSVHIVAAFFAYAAFTISFSAGTLYLIQNHELKSKKPGTFYHKLPSLEQLEQLIYRPMLWGAFLLVFSAVIGFVWSKIAFGEFLIFEPKTIATVLTVVLYGAILYFRFLASLRAKQGAVLSLIAFSLVILSFLGTRFIEGSHHYLR